MAPTTMQASAAEQARAADLWGGRILLLRNGHLQVPMLARTGRHWPQWFDFCVDAVRGIDWFELDELLELLPRALDRLRAEGLSPGATDRVSRVADLAAQMCAKGGAKPEGLAEKLLFSAIGSAARGRGPVPPELVELSERRNPAAQVSLPVLLVEQADGETQGLVADLTLWRLPQPLVPEPGPLFVPAPASMLLDLDDEFAGTLLGAAQLLKLRVPDELHSCRLVWDLSPRPLKRGQAGLHRIGGCSAGAAFALGALCLLRRGLPESQRKLLTAIDWPAAAVTAGMDTHGRLKLVAGIEDKIGALLRQDHPFPRLAHVFLARGQGVLTPDAQHVQRDECENIDDLILRLACSTGAAKLYGPYPDVAYELRGGSLAGQDPYSGFVGREWLTRGIQQLIDELGDSGGVVVLEAPAGAGKTAWSLRQVELNLAATLAPSSDSMQRIALDGWVFARRNSVTRRDSLSGDPAVVIEQLAACACHRLAYQSTTGDAPPARLPDLLAACARIAQDISRPVILLIDGVDEAFDGLPGRDIASANFLPQREWPRGVVLLLTGTSAAVGAQALVDRDTRQVRHFTFPLLPDRRVAAGDISGHWGGNQHDLYQYVRHRAIEILHDHPEVKFDKPLWSALIDRSAGLFLNLRYLLRPRDELPADLLRWRADPGAIPLDAAAEGARRDEARTAAERLAPNRASPAVGLRKPWTIGSAIAGGLAVLVLGAVFVPRPRQTGAGFEELGSSSRSSMPSATTAASPTRYLPPPPDVLGPQPQSTLKQPVVDGHPTPLSSSTRPGTPERIQPTGSPDRSGAEQVTPTLDPRYSARDMPMRTAAPIRVAGLPPASGASETVLEPHRSPVAPSWQERDVPVLATNLTGISVTPPMAIMRQGQLQKANSSLDFDMGGNSSKGLTDWFSTTDSDYLVMKFPPGQHWAGVWITAGKPVARSRRQWIDLSRFSTLKIEMKGLSGGEVIEIGIKSDTYRDDGSERKFRTKLEKNWYVYPFRLESFRQDLTRIYVIAEFIHTDQIPMTVYVRNIDLE